jgi:CheY-like chemotaxis protein
MSEEPCPSEDLPSRFRVSPVGIGARERPVAVVADGDPAFADRCMSWLAARGFEPHFAADGTQALLLIQRLVPAVAVIDAAVPGMYGFEICDFLRHDPALRSVRTVLLGTVHRSGRYRRPAKDVYGADAFVERTAVPEGLEPVLAALLPALGTISLPALGTTSVPALGTTSADSAPQSPAQPVAAGASPEAAPEDVRARRLARVIVSDLLVYHRAAFDTARTPEAFVAAIHEDFENGRKALLQRIGPVLAAQRDFLREELLAAAERRFQARPSEKEVR